MRYKNKQKTVSKTTTGASMQHQPPAGHVYYNMQLVQALREATSAAEGNPTRQTTLAEVYACNMTIEKYNESLKEP
jgi:hypothetical protein